MARIPVGILGATGMVGQQFIALLADHPWFEVKYLGASERSEGKKFRDAAAWRLANRLPTEVADRVVEAAKPGTAPKLVFSGLDSSVAGEIEAAFAQAGHMVVSNSRNYRLFDTVPLLIPEVNADHLALLKCQAQAQGWSGSIITNPNCAVIVLAMALAPLRQFGITSTMITTMQAISGAGYPGVPSWDILGNVIPHIGGGEEEKVEIETRKILGDLGSNSVRYHPMKLSATTTRVPVQNGHTGSISVGLEQKPTPEAIIDAWMSFRGRPQELQLPSAPPTPVLYLHEANRPQPLLDVNRDGGMTVTVGRLRPVSALRLQVRGARPQHDPRRRGRGDSQRRADAQRGTAVNVIMKFGGTSVADADAMTRVINIVRGHIARFPNHTLPVVVVSAMSKVTDRLVETGRLAGQGDADGCGGVCSAILLARHINVAAGLVQGAALETMSAQLTQDFNTLTEHVRGVGGARRGCRRRLPTRFSRWVSWRAAAWWPRHSSGRTFRLRGSMQEKSSSPTTSIRRRRPTLTPRAGGRTSSSRRERRPAKCPCSADSSARRPPG